MDECHALHGPWEVPDWSFRDGDDLDQSTDSTPRIPDDAGLNDFWLSETLPNTAAAAGAQLGNDDLAWTFPDLPVLKEFGIYPDPTELPSSPLSGSPSTNGSSGSGYSPSSMETGFTSPWTPWERDTPCVPPNLLILQSPQSSLMPPQGDFSNTPLYFEGLMTRNIHAEPESAGGKTPIELSGTSAVTQAAPQAAIADTTLTIEDKPPGIPSRKWRLQKRPVKCPVCNKGHTYLTELNKHIAARHRDKAASFGVSTESYVCQLCQQVCTRKDRLGRHMKNKHGIEPQKRRKRPGGVTKIKK